MKSLALPLATLLLSLSTLALPAAADTDGPPAVAMLRYAGGKTGECFSERFLARFDKATDATVAPQLELVEAGALDAGTHPVALFTGEGPFRLAPGEAGVLRDYLAAGGLLVASTGCSDPGWTESLEAALPAILSADEGFSALETLTVEHPVFQRVFTVETSNYAKGPAHLPVLRGSSRPDGGLAFVWSPEGLNDSFGVEGPCCCCGGNEVRAAEELLVNLLAIGFDADPVAAAE